MILFYSNEKLQDVLTLSGDEHTHCSKVLRRSNGDQIYVTDGEGKIYSCEIAEILRNQTKARIVDTREYEPIQYPLAIGFGLIKNTPRMEWFVEKAVEIGISEFFFFHAARSEGKGLNLDRINKIIISASKQSLNVIFPKLHYFKSLAEMLSSVGDKYQQKLIAHCNAAEQHISNCFDRNASSILLIGPEGDFTDAEISAALSHGYQEVNLGKSRLRSETAALFGLISLHQPL